SFTSDVYALGSMFQHDLELTMPFVNQMLADKPEDRMRLSTAISHLYMTLSQCPDRTPEIDAMLADYFSQQRSKRVAPVTHHRQQTQDGVKRSDNLTPPNPTKEKSKNFRST
ncbi:MAG TPA: hypothetical protein PLD88_09305, partial [Candidatus Berkiella sp.]|nr:hypothetical protein [Candidatus Berkiella sp.]